jgi:large subunit ribosomal protein L18Ae
LVKGRTLPTINNPEPIIYAMRIFAPNKLEAKSQFWKYSREQSKMKKTKGEILSCNEVIPLI